MPKLTETFVRKLPHSRAGTAKHWVTEIRGLVLFVGKRSKTWYYQKDVGGQTRRRLIGRYPVIEADAARATAIGLALDWGRGAGRSAQKGPPTLVRAMESYLAREKIRSEAHRHIVRTQFDRHLRDWLQLPFDEITKAMVVERHASMGAVPSAANHTLKYFRSVWNHARRVYDLPDSPTVAIEWFEERPTGSIIEDLRAWQTGIERLHNPIHRVYYELLLYTGFRKTEALTLTWKQVQEDHIHLPMTKNGRSFDLPIVQQHHEILAPLRGLSPIWVFPSPRSPTGHVRGVQRFGWTPHEHRRTFATVAMEAGVMEEIVGRLLNHTPMTITGQRYMKPRLDSLRPSMEIICSELDRRLDK